MTGNRPPKLDNLDIIIEGTLAWKRSLRKEKRQHETRCRSARSDGLVAISRNTSGRPMIEHVYRRVASKSLDGVYVATRDEELCEVVKAFGDPKIVSALARILFYGH